MARREKMKKMYQLIKLKTGTVKELKRLMADMAESSLDGLINTMIRITAEYRLVLKDTGWSTPRQR
jgi:hypothetical protein